ncbi:MAG: HAD family phosphatase [Oscillospiraceae bacterium]|nr:HAD family phosphatase [Oscillospiraceae bacterium]
MKRKMLLFDLDGTLLTSRKTVSERTSDAVGRAREAGFMIGISTSRSEANSRKFLDRLSPDVIISSGGALVTLNGDILSCQSFDGAQTAHVIEQARRICGDVKITVDTVGDDCEYYMNFEPDHDVLWESWGDAAYDDFSSFDKSALKICVEIEDDAKAEALSDALPECDCIRFTDGFWYKFTKAGITKESAIMHLCDVLGIAPGDIIAFGDDLADIGMLRLCGTGVAMGNAQPEVKAVADMVIGTNDQDGIADYLGVLEAQGRELV